MSETPITDTKWNENLCHVTGNLPAVQMRDLARSLERSLALATRKLELAVGALNGLAEWDDAGANERLAKTGHYCLFDEPGSVQIARETLARIEAMKEE